MGKLIKFDHVNTHGDFAALLTHCGIDFEKKGAQLRCLCPFHEDTNPSLSITLEATGETKANTWHCFGCKQSGSIIDFAAFWLEKTVRDGAELVAEVSGCGLAPPKGARKATRTKAKPVKSTHSLKEKTVKERSSETTKSRREPVDPTSPNPNQPLKFTLPLDFEHPYVLERLSQPEAYLYGVGVCPADSKSMMAGRCCVPIHDHAGQLVAYAGRYIGDDPKEPRWKFPPKFEKRRVLFGLHRLPVTSTVVLVEGFFDALRLQSLGVPAVSPMGTAILAEQVALLVEQGVTRAGVLFDGDEEGQAAVSDAVLSLSGSIYVRAGTLPVGDDPASASLETLRLLLRELLV